MNSMSRGYYEPCGKERKREEKCPTIIKCGCPGSVQFPLLEAGTAEFTVAALTLDTSCICDPVIKLNFSAVYTSLLTLTTGGISLQVYKQCKNQLTPVPVGPSWPVVGVLSAGVLLAPIYPSFEVCDTDLCSSDCCTYTVVATVTGILGASVAGSISNATLSAVVTCKNSCHKCR